MPDFGPGLYGVEVLYLLEYVQRAVAVAEYPFFEACAAVAAQFAEELFVYGFLDGVVYSPVIGGVGPAGYPGDGVAECPDLVDESQLHGIGSGPYAAFGDFAYVFDALFAALGASFDKEVVPAFYVGLHHGFFAGCHGSVYGGEVAVPVGLDFVEGEPYLVGEQGGSVGYHAEYADRPGEGGCVGKYAVCSAGEVVSAGCGVVAHGYGYGFELLEPVDGFPQLLGAEGAASGGVDAQDDAFYGRVLSYFVEFCDELAGVDAVIGRCVYFSVGVYDGDDVLGRWCLVGEAGYLGD